MISVYLLLLGISSTFGQMILQLHLKSDTDVYVSVRTNISTPPFYDYSVMIPAHKQKTIEMKVPSVNFISYLIYAKSPAGELIKDTTHKLLPDGALINESMDVFGSYLNIATDFICAENFCGEYCESTVCSKVKELDTPRNIIFVILIVAAILLLLVVVVSKDTFDMIKSFFRNLKRQIFGQQEAPEVLFGPYNSNSVNDLDLDDYDHTVTFRASSDPQ